MKKRLLSLLLAAVILVQIIPWSIFPAVSEGEEDESAGLDISELDVGRLYSAIWDDTVSDICIYREDPEDPNENLILYEAEIDKQTLPQELTVRLMKEDDFFLYITNEDWPAQYDAYRYVANYDLIIREALEPADGLVYGKVDILCNKAVGNTVTLDKGEKVYAMTELEESISDNAKFQWQMQLKDGRWADIFDYFYPFAVLSEALIANDQSASGRAALRCVVTDGDTKFASNELKLAVASPAADDETEDEVTVAEAAAVYSVGPAMAYTTSTRTKTAPVPAVASNPVQPTIQPLAEAVPAISDAFQIVIKYTFRHASPAPLMDIDGTSAANTFTVSLPENGKYTGEVASPPVVGYLPYVMAEDMAYITGNQPEAYTYEGEDYYLANSLSFSEVGDKTEIEVYYIPQPVNFLVKIYEQNLHNDEYVLAATNILIGTADSSIGDALANDRPGFTPLFYDPDTPISGDGTTAVDIYYDRNYYLVDFDLNSAEAYGATPYYVRYNSQVMLPTPIRPGYSFTGWSLEKVYTILQDDTENVISDTNITVSYDVVDAGKVITVQHNVDYRGTWSVDNTSYTLVYWLENSDSTDSQNIANYDVWYTHQITAQTDATTIAGADNIKSYIIAENNFTQTEIRDVTSTHPYLTYEAALSDTETKNVSGDGTTAINIYYSRKEYTLKFYYAMSNNDQYYVIGGSSNYFGSLRNDTDEIDLLDNYLEESTLSSQLGQVSKPSLNDKGTSRNYTQGADTSKYNASYQHHYISFKAKYGADISQLWPCDVFNSVTNQEKNTTSPKNGWTGTAAYVSAWNGEHNVKYTQVNQGTNQTVKGNYTVLDDNLLWDPSYGESDTVAFACFWENGAEDIQWNVPKLFRYNIYLPLLDGQDTTSLTTKNYDGITYYLHTAYDTCDDSNTSQQTQPGLVGFSANDYTSQQLGSTEFDTSVYKEAYDMFFFYDRISYNLTFNDQHGNIQVLSVPYGTDLSADTYQKYQPFYPSAFEAGEFEFDGWYIDEACQLPFDFNTTMPAKNIQLYAKWNTLSYTASVFLDAEKNISLGSNILPFGSSVDEPDYKAAQAGKPEYEHLIFAGWYYKDGDEEKRFDFKTMVVKHDIDIYAKWTSQFPVPYTVYYVIEDANGSLTYEGTTYTEIGERTEGVSLAGISKAFTAKVGVELNTGYQQGYFPANRSHAITMSETKANEYCFIYHIPESLTYTVTHEFVSDDFTNILGTNTLTLTLSYEITGESVKSTSSVQIVKFLDGITQETIIQAAIDQSSQSLDSTQKDAIWETVINLSPSNFEQEIILLPDTTPNVTFNWVDRGTVSTYQVIHYFPTLAGDYVADLTQEFVGDISSTVTAQPIERYGFEETNHDNSMTEGTITKVTFGQDGLPTGGLILRLYYARQTFHYTVHHYKLGTQEELAEADTTNSVPYETEISIEDHAKTIDGYTLYNGDTSVQVVDEGQKLICYYQGMDVYYRYQIEGSGGQFDVWNSDTVVGTAPKSDKLTLIENNYVLHGWYYQVDGGEKQPIPQTWFPSDPMTVEPPAPKAEWANKTITIIAEVRPSSLTIQNVIIAPDTPEWVTENQGFVYRIQGIADTDTAGVSLRVAVLDQQTILGLPVGAYTVTVENAWSWRYAEQSQNITVDGDETTSFSFAPPAENYTAGYYITDEASNPITPAN